MKDAVWGMLLVATALVACGSDTPGSDASTDAPADAPECTSPPIHCFCPTLQPTCVNGNWQCFGVCTPEAGDDAAMDAAGD